MQFSTSCKIIQFEKKSTDYAWCVPKKYLSMERSKRDEMKQTLQNKGIPSMVYYPIPLHLQKAYNNIEPDTKELPVSEKLSSEVLSLPIHTEMDNEMVNFVIDNVIDAIKRIF